MSQLISLDNACLAYGLDHLLDHTKLQINAGERVCLIGRNGAGKSSLLKIIEGKLLPDSGTIWRKPHLRLSRLAQELPQQIPGSVYDFVSLGLAETGQILSAYHHLTLKLTESHDERDLLELERLQQLIDAKEGWQYEQNISTILTRLNLDPDKPIAELSGGWQRRAALAQALVINPELLLLDEPTNHLDLKAIEWLEEQLLLAQTALLFITHDRSLLQRLATRIIELDRGQLTSWPGDYQNFLRRKEEMLNAEAQQNALFDKKLAEEEVWIRQGIKARRTRNEGRVRALEALRRERSERREVQGKATFNLNEANKSGKLVVEAENLTHRFDANTPLINDFSIRIMRGDRIALIGPNGIGKSTLLNILLGKLTPQHGKLTIGTNLEVAYFDQLRAALDLEKTVIDNVVQGSDMIEIQGKKRHIISYLGDFLFTPQRARTPVKSLSGGECNRLLLARLFSQPANVFVLDEPTNDLDIETLELLEELLNQFTGTLLLVSHDRTFVDNVVTSTLVFAGNGEIEEYIGGYTDSLTQMKNKKQPAASPTTKTAIDKTIKPKGDKLSYKEQKALSELPLQIETWEAENAALTAQITDPTFYQHDQQIVTATIAKLEASTKQLEAAYKEWEALLEKQNKS